MDAKKFENIVNDLSDLKKYESLYHFAKNEEPLPSIENLTTIVEDIKKVLFPGFFGQSELKEETINYYIGTKLDVINRSLAEQIRRGFCFSCNKSDLNCIDCEKRSKEISDQFISNIPKIKSLLATDVIAAFNGDPAAKNYGETIFCYPSIVAITYYRIAHELLELGVELIPRIISEMSHSKTGIDIHPGATIGEYFFIDHGTGVVIGETTIIGKNVRIYQGVTLGAKSFPLDENGKPIKGIARHPIIEDEVTIYSNATILGRITIGEGATIGGNQWVTEAVVAKTKVN
ncbi:MAG: serine acetyltransferase [Bacteroidetes bacterium]|nr:serine acetyltransferase [Bacteroidota bacterium]